ncbi:MAG: tRNA (guanosine(46)-N7)-methyltransferase TrmB [Hyphomicrobiales bacterium]|nr:MAG: tRNA (guanosine(46)-N7)-methyltransferase TrmB [Hyphomicrobiales bacterium]
MKYDRYGTPRAAFYGRRKGPGLSPLQKTVLSDLVPKLVLDISTPQQGSLKDLFDVDVTEIWLEIGYGGAEHMLHQAELNPHIGFIGCEPFVNGMVKAAEGIRDRKLGNIRLFDNDAVFLLDWLPPQCMTRVFLLYPDPWPKKRHWKRRFVSSANLDRIIRVLQPDGHFRFASDIDHYVNWALQRILKKPEFQWLAECAEDWQLPWPEWIQTRFEAKAVREGRSTAYLTFERRDPAGF